MMKFLAFVGLLAILGAIAAAIFFFGGYYSVAGTAPEPALVKWALFQVRDASVERYAKDNPPRSLNDPANVRAGARAFFERGCVNCHGGPGVDWAKFSEGLRPDPPDLKELANERAPQQLFWVIKNGIYMTGMPSFGAIEVPDQEIWTIVAFVKKLPSVSNDDFKAWTAPAASTSAPASSPAAPQPATPPASPQVPPSTPSAPQTGPAEQNR
jgi:mono/diheme cytochrome c family protein